MPHPTHLRFTEQRSKRRAGPSKQRPCRRARRARAGRRPAMRRGGRPARIGRGAARVASAATSRRSILRSTSMRFLGRTSLWQALAPLHTALDLILLGLNSSRATHALSARPLSSASRQLRDDDARVIFVAALKRSSSADDKGASAPASAERAAHVVPEGGLLACFLAKRSSAVLPSDESARR